MKCIKSHFVLLSLLINTLTLRNTFKNFCQRTQTLTDAHDFQHDCCSPEILTGSHRATLEESDSEDTTPGIAHVAVAPGIAATRTALARFSRAFVKMEERSEYELGDLVLAKVHRRPYWPALVQKCHTPGDAHVGEWRVEQDGLLWCVFLDSYASAWVHVNSVKKFTEREAECSLARTRIDAKRRLKSSIEKALAMQEVPASRKLVTTVAPPYAVAPMLSDDERSNRDQDMNEETTTTIGVQHGVRVGENGDADSDADSDREEKSEGVVNAAARETNDDKTEEDDGAAKNAGGGEDGNTEQKGESTDEDDYDYGEDEEDDKGDGDGDGENVDTRTRASEKRSVNSIPLLDDLVLAKTGTYPYWPAVVAKCISEKKKWNNRWVLFRTQRKPVRVWCSFVGDSTGSWVPPYRIRPFLPDFLDSQPVKPNSRLYADLQDAMKEATRIHRAKHRLKLALPLPTVAQKRPMSPTTASSPSPAKRAKATNADDGHTLGDLVLAKYDASCPYWPALIRECGDSDAAQANFGKWSLDNGQQLCCYFIKDGSEAWVDATGIKRFTAARARSYLCHKSSALYEVQREAIAEAAVMHKERLAERGRNDS